MDAKQLKDGDFFDTQVTLFKWIDKSFEALKLNFWTFLALTVIPGVILLFAVIVAFIPLLGSSDGSGALSGIGNFFAFLLGLIAIGIVLIFAPAIVQTQIASARGEKVELGDAFNKAKPFVLRFLGLAILSFIAIIVGLLLFVIPMFLVIFFISYAAFILVDKNTGVIEAIKASYELAKEYWKVTLGLLILNIVVTIIGYFPIIGGIASLVLSIAYFCLGAVVYVKIAGKGTATKEAKVVASSKTK